MAQATTSADQAQIRRCGEGRRAGSVEFDWVHIVFPSDMQEDALKRVPWHDLLDKFQRERLSFPQQDAIDDGQGSRFCKFSSR